MTPRRRTRGRRRDGTPRRVRTIAISRTLALGLLRLALRSHQAGEPEAQKLGIALVRALERSNESNNGEQNEP